MPSPRALAVVALVASLAAGIVAAPAPAVAAEADCVGTIFAIDGRVLFDLDERFIPAPLRGFDFDCASRLADESLDDGEGVSVSFDMLFVDIAYVDYVAIIRSFQDAGWGQPEFSPIDVGDGESEYGVRLGADELAALPAPPQYARAQLNDPETGRDLLTLDYTDGVEYVADPRIATPTLVVSAMLVGPFGGTGFDDPSVLSSLRTVGEAAITPVQGAVLGGSAVMLMLVVGYPGSLLGSVVSARYDAALAWLRRRRAGSEPRPRARPAPGWLVWPGFAIAAVIGGFVDPAFGPNLMSLRVLLSGLLGFLVFNLGVWTLVKTVMRRVQPDARPYIRFRWGSLVVVAIAVLVARLLDFQPGVIFGLVAGLAFGMTLALSRDALVILLGAGFGLVVAAIGWVGYSLLAPVSASHPALLFTTEFLSGVTIEGVSSLPLALLPLAALDGATVLRWKRWVWALAYAIGLAAFLFVLVGVPGSFGEIEGDFLRWVTLFIAFAVVALAVWAVDHFLSADGRRRRRKVAAAP